MILVQIFGRLKTLYSALKEKMFSTECSRLSYFAITCNDDEYEMMGHDVCLGQLYDVQN
jgi:hypothetical protein